MADVDRRAAGEFARAMVGHLSSAMLVTHLELGRRTGLLDVLASGPVTAGELARRTDLVPRYVEEWLGLVVAGGVVVHDPDAGTFHLPPERAAVVVGGTPYNLSGMVSIAVGAAAGLSALEEVFHAGGGVSYAEQPMDVDEVIDRLTRDRYEALLVDRYLGQVPGLAARLEAGARVLELGCGRGHAARLVAEAFPASEVVGLELSTRAVAHATEAARTAGIGNARFVEGTAASPPPGPWDVVCAFDVVHDLDQPYAALAAARRVLADDGVFLMIDSGAPATLAERAALPWAPMMYGVSLAHCLTVSLAQAGEGLGALWGRDEATRALRDAGFTRVETYELPGDPMDLLYEARA